MTVSPAALLSGPAIRPVAMAENWVHSLASDHGTPPKGAMSPDCARRENALYQRLGDVALIGVEGMLVPESGWIGYSRITGYDDLRAQTEAALADSAVAKIAYYVNSGGGYCEGLWEFSAWLSSVRGQKPTVALCQHAYSAAYAIACTCDDLVVAPMGGVGSIGTVLVHIEIAKALAEFGVAVNVIRAPDGKYRGNMLEALDDATRAKFQASVDELTEIFTAHVAAHRGIGQDSVLATDAGVFDLPSGTARAVTLGLADEALSIDDALQSLIDFQPAA